MCIHQTQNLMPLRVTAGDLFWKKTNELNAPCNPEIWKKYFHFQWTHPRWMKKNQGLIESHQSLEADLKQQSTPDQEKLETKKKEQEK